MAVSYLRAHTVSAIGDGSIVEIAARVALLIAIVAFIVLFRALHAPKSSKVGEETHAQRLPQPVGVQKKKGSRAKKSKKTRGAPTTRIVSDLEVISEEELEVGRVQSSSDVEAPSMRDSSKQESHSEVVVDLDKSDSNSGDIELDIRTDETFHRCGDVCLETVTLDDSSEDVLELGRGQSSSDVEAPSVPDSLNQESHSEVGVDHDKSESDSEMGDIDIGMRTDEAPRGCGHLRLESVPCDDPRDELPPVSALVPSEVIVLSDTSILALNDFDWDDAHQPNQSQAADDADVPCKECAMPDRHLWGCSAHRTYTCALLLMHREMQLTVARGPPGLERPTTSPTASRASLCSMRLA